MMPAPVNVKLENPTVCVARWKAQAKKWKTLNAEIGGHPEFYPLTIKAAYVIGVIHDICESVSCLLGAENAREVTYVPAYGIFASGIEVLGRCIRGDSTTWNCVKDLKTGFKWLQSSEYETVDDAAVLLTTRSWPYTINTLTALRHFAAHGQATVDQEVYQFLDIDYEILSMMPSLVADGLERYWSALHHEDSLCNRLANANILAFRNWPVYKSWVLFQGNGAGASITDIFNKFDWRV